MLLLQSLPRLSLRPKKMGSRFMATIVGQIIAEVKNSKAPKDLTVVGAFHPKTTLIHAVRFMISAAEPRQLEV